MVHEGVFWSMWLCVVRYGCCGDIPPLQLPAVSLYSRSKRTLSPVRLILEYSTKRSYVLLIVVSLQLGSIIKF
jgi:hypothetical protein